MNKLSLVALGAVLLGTAITAGEPAQAAVRVSVGVAAPAQECVTYKARHHRVVVARYAYCNEPVYAGEPIVISGVTYRENLHYRMHRGHREFWIKGRWVRHD